MLIFWVHQDSVLNVCVYTSLLSMDYRNTI